MSEPLALTRSYLYVPADRPDRLARAGERGADAVVVDLEDGVAPTRRPEAHMHAVRHVREARAQTWIRLADLDPDALDDEFVHPRVTGWFLPKVESGQQVHALDAAVTQIEQRQPEERAPLRFVPLIESAAGLVEAMSIATAPRVLRLGMGEADLAADLRLTVSEDQAELAWARGMVVCASAAARRPAPIGSTATEYRDLGQVERSSLRLLHAGFRARTTIHPAQVGVVNHVFTPSESDVAEARSVLARFETGVAAGRGSHGRDGALVDEAVARLARETLSRAQLAKRRRDR